MPVEIRKKYITVVFLNIIRLYIFFKLTKTETHSLTPFPAILHNFQHELIVFGQYSQQKWNGTCKLEAVHSSWTFHTQLQTPFLSHLLFGRAWWKLEFSKNKQFFQNVETVRRFFLSVIWVSSWTQHDVTETSISLLGKKNSEKAVFIGPNVGALGGGSSHQYFSSNLFNFRFPF